MLEKQLQAIDQIVQAQWDHRDYGIFHNHLMHQPCIEFAWSLYNSSDQAQLHDVQWDQCSIL